MKHKGKQSFFIPLLAGYACSAAFAQSPPDAGSLLQQIEKNAPLDKPRGATPKVLPPQAELQLQSDVALLVKAFRFAGNHRLDDATLQALVSPWVGRSLTLNELRRVSEAVSQAYRERGWVVRSYLPQQDVTDGVVQIQIVEAAFGGVKLETSPGVRVNADLITGLIQRQQAKGEALRSDAIERGLLLTDDLPGVAVSSQLFAGPEEGQTSLLLILNKEPLLTGDFSVDNTGARSTGANRAMLNVSLNSPMSLAEQWSASLMHAQGSDYGRVAVTAPIGLDGARAGISASTMNYRLVSPEYALLNAAGTAETLGVDYHYPVIRSRSFNWYFLANLDQKSFDNEVDRQSTSKYTVDGLSLSTFINSIDDWRGGGSNIAGATLGTGQLNLKTGTRLDGSEGHFSKIKYSLAREQVIGRSLTLYAAMSGQWSNDNLDSSERFYLGGSNGVRAFPSNEGGGSNGSMVNIELRYQIPDGPQLSAFFDHGHVEQYRHKQDSQGNSLSGDAPNQYNLAGYGVAFAWMAKNGSQFKGSCAYRLQENPNPSSNGSDQDGSLRKVRFWLSVSIPIRW